MKTKKNTSDDQKHNALKTEPLKANGEFCLSIGNETLHHLSPQQLKTFILQIHHIQKHPNPPTDTNNKCEENIEIDIQKHTQWHNEDEEPLCFYNINCPYGDISMIPLSRLKKLMEILQQAIGPHKTTPFSPPSTKTHTNFQIWRQQTPCQFPATFYSDTCVHKRTTYSSSSPVPETEYMLTANELSSNWISGEELSCLQQQLTRFMEKNKN